MGKLLAWNAYYSVGHPCLDEEHQRIIKLIDDLYVAIAAGQENARTRQTLDALVHYTMTHFDHEEQVMQECGYPDLLAHKALHDQMRQRTLDLRDNVNLVTGRNVLFFLKDWWTNHIQAEDKEYTRHLTVAHV